MAGNVVDWISARAKRADIALTNGREQLTFGELLSHTGNLAADVQAALSKGRSGILRIGVIYPSGLWYVPLALAVLRVGHCFVPIPDELSSNERLELAQRSALDAVLTGGPEVGWLGDCASLLATVHSGGVDAWLWAVNSGAPSFAEAAFQTLNPAFVRFSSGTTGRSKGVVLSHETLRDRLHMANSGLKIDRRDRVLWALPMAHHFAVSVVLYLYSGATTVIAEGGSLGEDLLALGRAAQITVLYASPVHYRQITAATASQPPGWPALRLAVSTASALDAATARAFADKFGKPLVQGLGIIEVGLPLLNVAFAAETPEALGLPQGEMECRLAPGTDELMLRGPGMFDAYLDPWALRRDVTDDDGWFATGDVARMDDGGRVFLVGRMKSVINVGGMKVFAEEVEAVLAAHDNVALALVQPRAHGHYGEVPVAKVVLKLGAKQESTGEILRFCRQRLSAYKVPVSIEIVTELPLTASGKLRR